MFGIWPVADFRNHPPDSPATYALIAILLVGVVAGVVLAWRRRAWGIPLYLATGLGGFLVVRGLGHVGLSSPWLNAKAMAEASPAVVAAGVAGAAALLRDGPARRGVRSSAVRSRPACSGRTASRTRTSGSRRAPSSPSCESVGKRFAGQGPALMTETEPYGVRHFLRNLDPEGAADRRRRLIPLLDGQGLAKGAYADLDQFQLGGILVYKTLVLARSPSESRPPSVYSLVWSGRYYDVWQRPDVYPPILAHTPLGDPVEPGGVPPCCGGAPAGRPRRAVGAAGRAAARSGRCRRPRPRTAAGGLGERCGRPRLPGEGRGHDRRALHGARARRGTDSGSAARSGAAFASTSTAGSSPTLGTG